jgi:hypothetical protein
MYECCPTHLTEIESIDELLDPIETEGALTEVVVQGLDLTADEAEGAVMSVSAEDACFLGCRLTEEAEDHIHETGAPSSPHSSACRSIRTGPPSTPPTSWWTATSGDGPRHGPKTVDAQIYEYFKSRQLDGRDALVMDASQNHYETFGAASPMVFFDESYWTEEKPVYPLLQTLAEGTPYADELQVTDDVDTVVGAITDHARTRTT